MAARRANTANLAAAQTAAAEAMARGDAARAIGPLRHIVAALPRNAGALHNLGLALSRTDQIGEAAHWFSRAVRADRRSVESLRLLSRQLQLMPQFHPDAIELAGLAPGLQATTLSRQPFVRAILDVLKRTAPLADLIDRGRSKSWEAAAEVMLTGEARALLGNPLFLDALMNGANVDYEIELLLTAARRHLLCEDNESLTHRRLYTFACALASQCWNNEYVFSVEEIERNHLAAMVKLIAPLRPDEIAENAPVIIAALAYVPATSIWPDQAPGEFVKVQPRALRTLIVDQLSQAREEAELGNEIPTLSEISDSVSRAVANQYEANPYPRWLSTDLPNPESARNNLLTFYSEDELSTLDETCRILIAGCGTGRQVVDLANQFGPAARITAIDLSRASLGYAAKMARRYGLSNVRFYRSDILELGALDESFALIVCDGVLHHMDDPLSGWRILTNRLVPGGLMRISLYSKLARQNLARDRQRIEAPEGAVSDSDCLRAYRAAVMQHNLSDAEMPNYNSYDYFTLSTFRDLMFHVQEHQFTVGEIAQALADLKLDFHGFVLPQPIVVSFRRRFPDASSLRDLDAWEAFEQSEPATFTNMYTFWCRKLD